MDRLLDIAVVGYGTAGQAVARLLQRQGHRLALFERAPQPRPIGAGLLLQPTGLGVLAELGLLEAALACGEPIHHLLGDTTSGRVVIDMRYARLDPAWFGLGIQRGALFELLRDPQLETRLRSGTTITAADEHSGELRDDQGQRYGPFDLILIAGGAASTLRQAGLTARDRAYPWGALWCLCADASRSYQGQLLQRYALARRMAGALPVGKLPGEPDAARKVSLFWSLPSVQLEPTRARGAAAWRDEVSRYWPQIEPLLGSIVDIDQLAPAYYRDAILRRFHRGRVAWLGDAAHAMSPQLGQGANMALLDASALASALSRATTIDQALAAFDRERRQHVWIYQFLSRWLTPVFQSDLDWAARARDRWFGPLGRAPFLRDEMLKVLAGVKSGLWRRVPVAPLALARRQVDSDEGAT